MTFSLRFLLRELWASRQQAVIFMLCTALSISSLVSVDSLSRDVNRSVSGDARALHGGDILIRSSYDFSDRLLRAVEGLDLGEENVSRTWRFYSVVRSGSGESTLFCNIAAVGGSYPLYGNVELLSGALFRNTLAAGKIIVAAEVLERLQAKVGDRLLLGGAELTIADVVMRESHRPVEVFSLGPRVFVSSSDLDRIGLVKRGSRVFHGLQLRVGDDEARLRALQVLQSAATPGQERVNSFETASSRLKRFYDNLLFFLSLISVFALFLAGIGMQSSLAALFRQKEKSLAIIKGLGASSRFILVNYLSLVFVVGLSGGILGIAAAAGFKKIFPWLFAGIVPANSLGGLTAADAGEGLLLTLLVVGFFTFLPLYRLLEVRPSAVFRREAGRSGKGPGYYLLLAAGLGLLTLVVVRLLEDVRTGLAFMAGSGLLIMVLALLIQGMLMLLRRNRFRSLPLRQAVRSLLRPGNATRAVTVTLASALAVLTTIYLVEDNLRTTFVEAYPPDAPNVFLVDIQPDQRTGVVETAGREMELFPIIRGRLKAINGLAVAAGERAGRFSDSLTREFNLTYRSDLLEDEILEEGASLFQRDRGAGAPLQVSILDMVADMGDFNLGDLLEFNIQGVPVTAEVVSVRSRTRSKLYPFFYFVFQPQDMANAPQTLFGALRVESGEVAALQSRVVAAYPNVSLINLTSTAAELGAVMKKLSGIVSFFAFFPIVAGIFILIGAIVATRLDRAREAVYYKIMGGGKRFVAAVFLWENLLLGVLSSLAGVAVAGAGSWVVCRYIFEIEFTPGLRPLFSLAGVTIILVGVIGLVISLPVIRQKPAQFLREE